MNDMQRFRWIVVTLSSLFLLPSFAQPVKRGSIRGMITDAETGEALPYTDVFLSNTTLGDAADDDGGYVILNIPPGSYQLVVSRIGYRVEVQDITVSAGTTLRDVRLSVKSIEGEEISVVAVSDKQWQRDLKEFQSYFIGETANAKKCSIINPEILSFQRDAATNDLVARSDSFLVIDNRALGYRIEIILDSFRWGRAGGFYLIYPRYYACPAENARQARRWEGNRRETFFSSMRNFFASLATGAYAEDYIISRRRQTYDFIKTAVLDSLTISCIDSTPGLRRLQFDGVLQVERRAGGSSNLYLNYGFVDFDSRGNIYPADAVKISGHWGQYRVADSLPFDYWPEE
ncbi:carboxypeptidase-like regulatory domain-containing protein [candidate division KSB1 bacterium]|nr:carboxypeptidase-like regulatory domain-containing protein [candidate division KSB1 bacterium]